MTLGNDTLLEKGLKGVTQMITKPHKITVKANPQELALIKANAAKAGYCLSEYIRLAAMGLPVQPKDV